MRGLNSLFGFAKFAVRACRSPCSRRRETGRTGQQFHVLKGQHLSRPASDRGISLPQGIAGNFPPYYQRAVTRVPGAIAASGRDGWFAM